MNWKPAINTNGGERMSEHDKIGSAILGFYAAIKICEKDGYDWQDVASLAEPVAKEHAAITNAQRQTK